MIRAVSFDLTVKRLMSALQIRCRSDPVETVTEEPRLACFHTLFKLDTCDVISPLDCAVFQPVVRPKQTGSLQAV